MINVYDCLCASADKIVYAVHKSKGSPAKICEVPVSKCYFVADRTRLGVHLLTVFGAVPVADCYWDKGEAETWCRKFNN